MIFIQPQFGLIDSLKPVSEINCFTPHGSTILPIFQYLSQTAECSIGSCLTQIDYGQKEETYAADAAVF